jgi:hypothetical protein
MAPPFSVEAIEELVDDSHEHEEREDGHDRRQVERPERRQDATEEPQVRLADVRGGKSAIRRTQTLYGSRTHEVST